MKKIFEIEWNYKVDRKWGEGFVPTIKGIEEYLKIVIPKCVGDFKITEIPQPTELEDYECKCEKPIQGIWGATSKVYLCNTCGLPIKPKLEKLALYQETVDYDFYEVRNNRKKINEIIEWINQEAK